MVAPWVIGPTDLQDEPFIAYAPEDRSRHRLDTVLAEAGVTPRIVVETALASTVYALAAEGVGIGLANPLFNPGLDRARVVTRSFEPKTAVRSLLILPPDRPKSVLVRDFITALLSVR